MADTSDKLYTGLSLWAVRSEDQGAWLFGVTLDGADVVLAGRKLGGVDSDLESARLEAAKQPQPSASQPTGTGETVISSQPAQPSQ